MVAYDLNLPEIVDRASSMGIGLRIYPCINPSGFEAQHRYNARRRDQLLANFAVEVRNAYADHPVASSRCTAEAFTQHAYRIRHAEYHHTHDVLAPHPAPREISPHLMASNHQADQSERKGDGEVASETDSLLHLGRICDAHKLAAETLAASIESGG